MPTFSYNRARQAGFTDEQIQAYLDKRPDLKPGTEQQPKVRFTDFLRELPSGESLIINRGR